MSFSWAGMFLPEAWHWHEAYTQWTCQNACTFLQTLSRLSWIYFLSISFILLNVDYIVYGSNIYSFTLLHVYQFFMCINSICFCMYSGELCIRILKTAVTRMDILHITKCIHWKKTSFSVDKERGMKFVFVNRTPWEIVVGILNAAIHV